MAKWQMLTLLFAVVLLFILIGIRNNQRLNQICQVNCGTSNVSVCEMRGRFGDLYWKCSDGRHAGCCCN